MRIWSIVKFETLAISFGYRRLLRCLRRIFRSSFVKPSGEPRWRKITAFTFFLIIVATIYNYASYTRINEQPRILRPKSSTDDHFLCILVPYRSRHPELDLFVSHMEKFLGKQNITYRIVVLNQLDNYRYNRGALLNIGWFEAVKIGCDYLSLHDVDLLPLNDLLDYSYPGSGTIRHLSSPEHHPMYHYDAYFGGVLLVTVPDFEKVNGMCNDFWGWGHEDDDFYVRIQLFSINVERPKYIGTGRYDTFKHVHDGVTYPRDQRNYWTVSTKTLDNLQSGLKSLQYNVSFRRFLVYSGRDDHKVIMVDVMIVCSKQMQSRCIPD